MRCSEVLPICADYVKDFEDGNVQCRDVEGIDTRENVTRNASRKRNGRKRNGRKGSRGSCPGGSLDDCIAACPTQVRVYRACVANCGRKCNNEMK